MPCRKRSLLNYRPLISMLLLMLLNACSAISKKNDQLPPPAPPSCFLPISKHIYGKPTQIRETCISARKPHEDITTLNRALRQATYSSPYVKEIVYLGTDLRPDSSRSEVQKRLQHYLKTPYYQYYYTFSRTEEPAEYHFYGYRSAVIRVSNCGKQQKRTDFAGGGETILRFSPFY